MIRIKTRFPPFWPGFKSGTYVISESLILVSSLLRGFISGLLGFSPSSKSNISEFQFDPESKRNRMQRNNQRNNFANKVLLVFSCSWHQWLVLIIRILIDLLPYCILARFPGIECRETCSKATTVVNNNRTPMNQSENAANIWNRRRARVNAYK